MDSVLPMHTIPRGPMPLPAPSAAVPSTRPPSFATYPPSVYPPSVYSRRPRHHPYTSEPDPDSLPVPRHQAPAHVVAATAVTPALGHHPAGSPFPIQSLQRIIPHSPAWYTAKIIIRSLTLLCAIAVVSILIIMLLDMRYLTYNLRPALILLPICAVTIIDDILELVVICVRRRLRRGMHPGVTVGGDLIVWILSACALGINVEYSFWWLTTVSYAVEALFGALCLGHFVLFVRACIETKQRNKSKDSSKLTYVFSPGGGKPFPILKTETTELDPGSEASWTAVTAGGTSDHSPAQRARAPDVVSPLRPTATTGLGRSYAPSPSPPRSPSGYWQPAQAGTAGAEDGFHGYRGPTPSEDEVNGLRQGAAPTAPPPPGSCRPNQKEIIPPEIMAEYHNRSRVRVTSTASYDNHDRIAGPSNDLRGA